MLFRIRRSQLALAAAAAYLAVVGYLSVATLTGQVDELSGEGPLGELTSPVSLLPYGLRRLGLLPSAAGAYTIAGIVQAVLVWLLIRGRSPAETLGDRADGYRRGRVALVVSMVYLLLVTSAAVFGIVASAYEAGSFALVYWIPLALPLSLVASYLPGSLLPIGMIQAWVLWRIFRGGRVPR
ncbi:hypothetical protein AB0B45_32785 [Nonomuraea sp. NPDC049152]|uniref:hypothetical protein n=1 Tax=Nonomuraea sp. NPDC049152 TaxID=3154350 RepID=UPI0033CC67DF